MNILILAKNYENYTAGYYHQDIINSFINKGNCYLYGEGYNGYNVSDNIHDVIAKSKDVISHIDLIVVSTSWELQTPELKQSDPHPSIDLSIVKSVPKVFFLNKEYKKLEAKLEYAKRNRFDLVCTVHPDWEQWSRAIGLNFLMLPMGIDTRRFKILNIARKWDFSFTGNLHQTHLDTRFDVKKKLFKEKYLEEKSNLSYNNFYKSMIKEDFSSFKIYWAEWGSKRGILYQRLLPSGQKYNELLNQSKVFLNTPSAAGIINTRFFELMATKTLILCPQSEFYNDMFLDGYNCIMFRKDLFDFREKFKLAIEDEKLRAQITEKAYSEIERHSYDSRINAVIEEIWKRTPINLFKR